MSTLHSFAIVVHVVSAILGLGVCSAVIVTAVVARKNPAARDSLKSVLVRLYSLISVGLAFLLLSGIALDVASHGAWHGTVFFRIGFVLLFVIGGLGGASRGRIRKISEPNADAAGAFALVEKLGWVMCGAVALAAVLMVLKPG